jgi:cystathionine gamma-lyase
MSPFYSSPLLQGADIVLHSLTKFINGHTDVVMGVVILPQHHAVLHERLVFLQCAIGAVPSAYDCWLAQRGARTLHVRMKEHGCNALLVARALERSPYVKEVIYPGLASHPRHEIARRLLSPHAALFVQAESEHNPDGSFPYGGMVSFRIRGGFEEAQRFLRAIRVFTLAVSLGGVESLAGLPAVMTHGEISPAERALRGIGDNLIRLSVGIEDGSDIVRDIEQALRAAAEGKP